ncbi:MAG: hypothetical protein R3254_03790 [Thiomicrorhabdus sp.]|nr:hypothetical protein [Thiomicrorhabdus sp.]
MKKWIFLILLFFIWKHFYYVGDAPEVGPGVLASGVPYQGSATISSFRKGDYTYYPQADFQVEARVLSVSKYYFDQEARISPVDFVLGWGQMSDESVLQHIDIWQENRWYKWESQVMPIPKNEIIDSSANMHMIPDNQQVANQLKQIRNGDLVNIQGYLVDVRKSTGWKWKTSVSRSDSGAGACEVVYVKKIDIIDPSERLNY